MTKQISTCLKTGKWEAQAAPHLGGGHHWQKFPYFTWICSTLINTLLFRLAFWGPNSIQFSRAGAAVLMGHALHPLVGWQSQRLPQGKETFVPLLPGCTAAAPVLESGIGLGPESCHFHWYINMVPLFQGVSLSFSLPPTEESHLNCRPIDARTKHLHCSLHGPDEANQWFSNWCSREPWASLGAYQRVLTDKILHTSQPYL